MLSPMDYDVAIGALLGWVGTTDDVRAVVLTGSAAIGGAHPLSDRDVELYVRDPALVLADESWWRSLGEVLAVEELENADDHNTRLVYYAGGKLDFTIVPVDDVAALEYDRPFSVLLDKDGLTDGLTIEPPEDAPPTQEEFDEAMNWAWAAALMVARAIVRAEPWSVKVRDHDLKTELLRVIEWDHRARHGSAVDVRYLGTRMHSWMDSDVQARLDHCWAGFSLAENAEALRETVALFSELSTRTAERLGLDRFAHEPAIDELERVLAFR